jgi:hypothetical protein
VIFDDSRDGIHIALGAVLDHQGSPLMRGFLRVTKPGDQRREQGKRCWKTLAFSDAIRFEPMPLHPLTTLGIWCN